MQVEHQSADMSTKTLINDKSDENNCENLDVDAYDHDDDDDDISITEYERLDVSYDEQKSA